jgi:hypothetical protein
MRLEIVSKYITNIPNLFKLIVNDLKQDLEGASLTILRQPNC